MSNQYVDTEVKKIIDDSEFSDPLNFAMAGAWVLGNLKGINLKVMDVSKTSSLADYFVLASATNTVQAKSMADTIITQLKKHGRQVLSKEGIHATNSDWILIDLGSVIVHIFIEVARDIYGLEDLWKEAEFINIPQNYYTSGDDEVVREQDNRDYF